MKHFYVYYSYEEWGRGYIGKRESKCLPEDDTTYFGSYRDKTFKPTRKIILGVFDNKQDAIEAEIALHEFFSVDVNPHFANKAKQTSTGFSYDRSGHSNSERWYEKMSGDSHPCKRPEVKEKLSRYQRSLGDRHNSRSPEGRERARRLLSGDNNPNRSPEGRQKCRDRMNTPERKEKTAEIGRKVFGELYKDPDHPELGLRNVGNLVQAQKRRGLPSGSENRVKVTNTEM